MCSSWLIYHLHGRDVFDGKLLCCVRYKHASFSHHSISNCSNFQPSYFAIHLAPWFNRLFIASSAVHGYTCKLYILETFGQIGDGCEFYMGRGKKNKRKTRSLLKSGSIWVHNRVGLQLPSDQCTGKGFLLFIPSLFPVMILLHVQHVNTLRALTFPTTTYVRVQSVVYVYTGSIQR